LRIRNTGGGDHMQTKEAILFALNFSNGALMSALDEMSGAPTTFPTPNGGCHPLWVIGHLAFVEGMIPEILFGEPNPVAEWATLFGTQSEARADASGYPAFAQVRGKYEQLRARNLALLESFSEADLDRKTVRPPARLEHEFATFGQSFLTVALHQA